MGHDYTWKYTQMLMSEDFLCDKSRQLFQNEDGETAKYYMSNNI